MRPYLAVAAAMAVQVSVAHAETIVALVGDDILATVDSQTARTRGLLKIEGIGPVLGIDVRPADGQLYALADDGAIATVDPSTGKATLKSKLDMSLTRGIQMTVDFNPVADRMRIIGEDGTNLRVDVDSGKVTKDQPLKFAETDAAAGRSPAVVAGAYGNSVKGAKETTLYDIDAGIGSLLRQAPPNDGILNTIGQIGLDVDSIGFDIVTDGTGANTGMLVAKGNLYVLDLMSGKASGGKSIAGLPSGVRDIAVLPASAQKQALNTMTGGSTSMKASSMMTSSYQQSPAPGTVNGAESRPMQMKAGYEGGMGVNKSYSYRADPGSPKVSYSAPKRQKGGPRCDDKAVY